MRSFSILSFTLRRFSISAFAKSEAFHPELISYHMTFHIYEKRLCVAGLIMCRLAEAQRDVLTFPNREQEQALWN